MFIAQLRNELWKLFGKKRTYIGFGAFILAQTAMLLAFKFTRWQSDFERLLSGNGYVATEFVSALTVSVVMLMPQIILLMPLYATLVGGDLVAKEYEDGTLADDFVTADFPRPVVAGEMGCRNRFRGGAWCWCWA